MGAGILGAQGLDTARGAPGSRDSPVQKDMVSVSVHTMMSRSLFETCPEHCGYVLSDLEPVPTPASAVRASNMYKYVETKARRLHVCTCAVFTKRVNVT
jgi:hypothetical protein